jgi:hypothetical protein
MELIVVERSFADRVDMPSLAELERKGAGCLEQHGVRPLHTWVARDGRHAVCFYEAPDAEAVRTIQRNAGMPFDHVWRALFVPVGSDTTLTTARECVVVQRELPAPLSADVVLATREQVAPCERRHRISPLGSYVQLGGVRALCCFRAVDAEAVRIAQRESGMPTIRAWSAVRFGD